MSIRLRRERNGSFCSDEVLDFTKGGSAEISVNCDGFGHDEMILKKEAVAYLNDLASTQGMRVEEQDGPLATVPVKVKKGESARVRYIKFPAEIAPLINKNQNGRSFRK